MTGPERDNAPPFEQRVPPSARLEEDAWPVALLLDEAWLCARRLLVKELEARGLWPGHAQYRTFTNGQWRVGETLRRGMLKEVLGEDYRPVFGSETLFGALNHRVRSRLPFVLAFGYELGWDLCQLVGHDQAVAQRVGERCAIFNLGVSVFDLVWDNFPRWRRELGRVFDEDVLRDLTAREASAADLNEVARSLDCLELRFLLRLIAAFFRWAEPGEDRTAQPSLSDLLVRAYSAEIQASAATPGDAGAVAREKSTLPFAVMGALIGQTLPGDRRTHAWCDRVAADLGGAFWMIDDLADVAIDFRKGGVNALLVRAGCGGLSAGTTPSEAAQGLTRLLESRVLQDAAFEAGERLDAARTAASMVPDGHSDASRFSLALGCYARHWIE